MSMVEDTITAGMANTIMKEVTSEAQTNNGIRSNVMPGARILKMVTILTTATARPDSSV